MNRAQLTCTGCGRIASSDDGLPFKCQGASPDDDIDHVLARRGPPAEAVWPVDEDSNPFVRFRTLSYSWQLAQRAGITDVDYVALVRNLDSAVAEVDGHGFEATPLVRGTALEAELELAEGQLWIKDETRGVAGSHKARHLMGIAIAMAVAERSGLAQAPASLAIASCGNAALAAAVVARAAGRPLRVAVPTWADPTIVTRLEALGASLETCPRTDESPPGDPCFHRFGEWVAAGALPFTVQGSENALAIDGGMTLGWELADQLRAGSSALDRLFVQIGGGALASSCVQALRWAVELGVLHGLPRIHAVQTVGVQPLAAAWRRVAERAKAEIEKTDRSLPAEATAAVLAEWLRPHFGGHAMRAELGRAACHRSEYMRAVPPQMSVATGILDDETYDWREVTRGMLETGGWPIAADEPTLVHARDRAQAKTGIGVDATGSAGLAGVFAASAAGALASRERIGVLFTGGVR